MKQPNFASDLPDDLIREMIAANPHAFQRRRDVENRLGHRLQDIKSIQRIQGIRIGDDFVLCDDGGIITEITWFTGWKRGAEHLIIELTGHGGYCSHTWASISADLQPSVMVSGVLPDLPLTTNTAHLASRRFRGNHIARRNLDPANIEGAVRAAILSNTECPRTVFDARVSYAVFIGLYGVFAMVSANRTNGTLEISTIISPWQMQRHVNSAYLGRNPVNGGVY